MYVSGDGVEEDDLEGFVWFRKAADQGYVLAQHDIGMMYADGDGVPQDDVEAHMWLNLAASGRRSNPSEEAVTARDTVAARMTPDDLSEAQRRARELETAREGDWW